MSGRLLVLAAMVLGASMLGLAGARAASTFPDPVGDVSGGRGPDLTAVSISHTATTVTFRIRFAKAPPLRMSTTGHWVDMLLVGIDVPPRGPRPQPTGWIGADYWTGTHGTATTGMLVKASKGKATPIRFAAEGKTLRFSIPRRLLGNPASFDVAVFAGREGADAATGGGSDSAPASGTFHYRLR